MLLLFAGTDDSGAFSTFPDILIILDPTLEFTVIVFTKLPGLPCVLYVAETLPDFPGAIGSFVHVGVVQPHEA
jgi:hypothetical protein